MLWMEPSSHAFHFFRQSSSLEEGVGVYPCTCGSSIDIAPSSIACPETAFASSTWMKLYCFASYVYDLSMRFAVGNRARAVGHVGKMFFKKNVDVTVTHEIFFFCQAAR